VGHEAIYDFRFTILDFFKIAKEIFDLLISDFYDCKVVVNLLTLLTRQIYILKTK
jgi:hypothetical protein